MKDYLLNKNIGLIDLNEIELNAFEIENDIILSHLGDSDEEFDNLVCNILTLDPENNSEVKPYQHRAILVLDPKTDELMAEFDQTGLKAEPREAFLETFRRIVDPNDKRIKSNVDLRTEGSWDFFADTLKGSKEIVG